MSDKARRRQAGDSSEWEVAEDVQPRPLGSLVAVRFDAPSARKLRRCASELGLTLSEFIRRASLTVAEYPELLAPPREIGRERYVSLTGNAFNLTWWPQEPRPLQIGEETAVERRRPRLTGPVAERQVEGTTTGV
jgi:hypothetical protein